MQKQRARQGLSSDKPEKEQKAKTSSDRSDKSIAASCKASREKDIRTIDFSDLDTLLTRFENLCYACEHKVKWPDQTYRASVNKQIARDLDYLKRLQKQYPRR